jgi:hypothetical protein
MHSGEYLSLEELLRNSVPVRLSHRLWPLRVRDVERLQFIGRLSHKLAGVSGHNPPHDLTSSASVGHDVTIAQ